MQTSSKYSSCCCTSSSSRCFRCLSKRVVNIFRQLGHAKAANDEKLRRFLWGRGGGGSAAAASVPLLVLWCIERVETAADHELVGIYRRPGDWDTVEKLRLIFAECRVAEASVELFRADVKSVGGLLKRYLYGCRSEPIIPQANYHKIIQACDIVNPQARAFYLAQVLKEALSRDQYEMCEAIFCHLGRMAGRWKATGMTAEFLAKSWAPIIFHVSSVPCELLQLNDAVRALQLETKITETAISNFEIIFPHEIK